jgi:plastocyanin
MLLPRLWSCVVAATVLACGGGGEGTTEPPDPPDPGGNTQVLGSITPNATSVDVPAGTTSQLSFTAYDTQGVPISNPGVATFTSLSPTVVEVDASGLLLGLNAGSAQVRISLTRGTVTKEANVTVRVSGSIPVSVDVVASSNDYLFTPRTVAIARNGSVTWSFGVLEHTVTFQSMPGAPQNIASGYLTTVSRTFPSAGNFSYTCTIHAGMTGLIYVR